MRRDRTAKRKELSATLKEIKSLHKAIEKGKTRVAELEGGLVKEETISDAQVAGEVLWCARGVGRAAFSIQSILLWPRKSSLV